MKNPSRFKVFFPFLVVILFPVLLFLELFLKGKVLYWGTTSLQFLPWLTFAWKNLLQGQIPLWNPLNGMGSPFIANYQSAFFYPPTWITFPFYLLGGVQALNWGLTFLVICHISWAGIGMVLLIRKLRLPPISQMISGIAFACSSFLLARVNFISMVWAFAWFPWVFWAAEFAISPRKEKTFWNKVIQFAPLILCMTMQLLAGHAQITWYCFLLAAIWVIVSGWKQKGFSGVLSNLSIFACCGFVAFALTCVQILPTLELLLNSQRASEVGFEYATNYSLWPWRLFTLLAPNLYGSPANGTYWGYGSFWEDAIYIGFLPILFALSTIRKIFRESDNSRYLVFLWCVVIISILLALGKNFYLFPFLYHFIPTFNLFQAPARFMVWAIFSLSILAGIGISEWERINGWDLYCLRLSIMASVAIILAATIALTSVKGQVITIASSAILFGFFGVITGAIILWRNRVNNSDRNNKISLILLATFVCCDLFFANKYSIPLNVAQEELSTLLNGLKQESNGTRVYFDKNTIYNLYYSRFFRFNDFRFLENQSNLFSIALPNANLIRGKSSVNIFDPLLSKRYAKWMDLLEDLDDGSKKEILAFMNVGEWIKINPKNSSGYTEIKINNSSRFHWFSCAIFTENEEEAFQTIKNFLQTDPEIIELQIIVERERKKEENNCLEESTASFSLIEDSGNKFEITFQSNIAQWLMVSDINYPGWEVLVDGKKQEIFPAQYIFKAIELQPGKHDIIFTYRPRVFVFGVVISCLSIVCFVCLYIIAKLHTFREHGINEYPSNTKISR